MARADTADSAPVQLQLDVRINGYPLNLIAAFMQMPDGRIASTRGELMEIGVAVPGDGFPDEVIKLDQLAGLSYVFDEENQAIEIELPNASRIPKVLDAPRIKDLPKAESGNGFVVNYTAFASGEYDMPSSVSAVDGGSLTLDARAFSKFGTIRQTGIVGTTTFSDFTALRLDTSWQFSDQENMRTYQLGDIVSGGLAWTRPIRIGGAQVRRNFGLRPDLITEPLPQIDGTAAVPSTLDVFIGNVQAYSTAVQPGPFRIDSLPVYTSQGTARVVLTDSTGRETESEQEFYTSSGLLMKNLYDFSLEAGVARREFGTGSFGYDDQPVAVGSLRYGITNSFTAEAHAEGGSNLIDVGLGGLFAAGPFGELGGAVAGSTHEGDSGLFINANWAFQYRDLNVSLSTSRTFGAYKDLAAVTDKHWNDDDFNGGVPRIQDQVSFNYAFPKLDAGIGMSFINQVASDGKHSYIVSGSYSQGLPYNVNMFVNGFANFGDDKDFGAFAGFSMPFGGDKQVAAGMSASQEGVTGVAEVSKSSDGSPGSYSWRLAHGEGDPRYTSANGTYHGTKATVEGRIYQDNKAVTGNVAVEGAAVIADGGVFLGNQIWDSFAVVDAGAPNVSVEYENRFAGKTDSSGKLLLPQLRSFQSNKVSIDVNDLPLTAAVGESEEIVVPRDMSGVVVDFGVKTDEAAALLILTDGDGKVLPESSEVALAGSTESFVMGYDGQVYLTGIGAENTVTVTVNGKSCQASFSYKSADAPSTIGPVKCL